MKSRGRPAGSVSFIGVKLSDLNKILIEDAIVLVDRRYKDLIDANSLETHAIKGEAIETVNASAPVDFKVS
jgi:hypothetical protein